MINLECIDLCKWYGKTEVFRSLNFRCVGPACIGLQGENGSGKSTLLKCISGLLRPSSGEVRWMGPNGILQTQNIRYSIGYSASYLDLYSELTVLENLVFLKKIRPKHLSASSKLPLSKEIKAEDELLENAEKFAIGELLDRPYGTLSSGQQQRVKLAGSFIGFPPVLIMDEPTTNLDTTGVDMVLRVIEEHRSAGGISFLASNRVDELKICNQIISLSPGNPL